MRGQVYASRGMVRGVPFVSGSSYRPVRVSAREKPTPDQPKTGQTDRHGRLAVILALGTLAALDGIIFVLIGLR